MVKVEKVAIYARVSTDEQELVQQIAACENYRLGAESPAFQCWG